MSTTTFRKNELIEMFIDATAGESYDRNRLVTREAGENTVNLIAYGWMKLAEYDESAGHVTVYDGHREVESKTIDRWLDDVINHTADRREFTLSDQSPVVDTPNEGIKFVDEYISFEGGLSAVERKAKNLVDESLSGVLS